jgi:hypothetical protein
MTVAQLIATFRQLELEHPHTSNLPVVIVPHGFSTQELERVHLSVHEDRVVLEGERK